MNYKILNKYFRLEFFARKDLQYGQLIIPTIYIHNRGVRYIGKLLGRKIFFPYFFRSFRIELLWLRYAISIDFVKYNQEV